MRLSCFALFLLAGGPGVLGAGEPGQITIVEMPAERGADIAEILSFLRHLPREMIEPRSDANDPLLTKEAVFGEGLRDESLNSWFTRRIRWITVVELEQTAAFLGSGGLALSDGFFKLSRDERASLLIHEARHADGEAHIACPPGLASALHDPLGFPGCDESKQGAYAYQALFVLALLDRGLCESTLKCVEILVSSALRSQRPDLIDRSLEFARLFGDDPPPSSR